VGQSQDALVVYQPPTLAGFSPEEAKAGEKLTVTHTGTHFAGDLSQDTVWIGGVVARVLTASQTQLTVELPREATTGPVLIGTPGGRIASPQPFVVWQQPVLTDLSPGAGKAGTVLTLTGQHFAPSPARNIVRIGEAHAPVEQASATRLVVRVPAGAQSGPVEVRTPGGVVSSAQPFVFYLAPALTDFSPKEGTAGTVVTLSGTHFGQAAQRDTVFLNQVEVVVLTATATTLTVRVPRGAQTGRFVVAGIGGRAESSQDFRLTHLPDQEAVQVYPNPTQGKFTVDWTKAEAVVQAVRVYNAVGQLVYSQAVGEGPEDKLLVDLPTTVAGLYVVVVQTGQGTVVKRVVGR
jgi:hypothetical protein